MENGSDGLEPPDATPRENGEIMADSPTEQPANADLTPKVNGEEDVSDEPDSSDCDALIIDETAGDKKSKGSRKKNVVPEIHVEKQEEDVPHSNPYFSESLFELSQQHHSENTETASQHVNNGENKSVGVSSCKTHRKLFDKKGKLREYAQYLGLQPTVQFKCSKCGRSGFPTLASLNEHHQQCTAEPPPECDNSMSAAAQSTNFRVTRKVFLCSACGTYYENWNLFLHMLEVHKRFICLYCLGMFSHPEKLSQHLMSKHNCVPGYRDSLEDFYHLYKEPCFLMCCECERVFNEQDNFFSHLCIPKSTEQTKNGKVVNNHKTKKVKTSKIQVGHVTADTADSLEPAAALIEEEAAATPQENQTQDHSVPMVTNVITEESSVSDANENAPTSNVEQCKEDDSQIDGPLTDDNVEVPTVNEISQERDAGAAECEQNEVKESSITPEVLNSNSSSHSDYNNEDSQLNDETDGEETRKVPKVTLKLPKPGSYPDSPQEDSDDSEKLTMEVDQADSENEEKKSDEQEQQPVEPQIQVAGPDISIVELELEQPLDKTDIRVLLQKCLTATVPTCIYCNHARKIAVNGKQLGLHAIAEHRFSAVVNSITAEELIPESFVARIKEGFPELEEVYFNLDSSSSDEAVTFSHVFECFQCRFSTTVHKELYLHNRKSHAKTILLCIMCKSVFYSYSELICHLCPGIYALDNEVRFRCCMCISKDLPSAFRLLVHLRKKHHACDVCLELCHDQARLSSHVWKHKLHHFCYRCGIAYRNKPDITKHLFWKHGTESVLCKKCLQKKWPHVYHFCVPPSSFTCEECNLSFTKAVALKVHKRIHADEKPHACTIDDCTERFVSKKLLLKHEFKHREPQEESQKTDEPIVTSDVAVDDGEKGAEETAIEANVEEKPVEKPKPKVDVYDLPELNLSESDSSDSENGPPSPKPQEHKTDENTGIEPENATTEKVESETNEQLQKEGTTEIEMKDDVDGQDKPVPILENVWDDFKNYQANKGKLDQILTDTADENPPETAAITEEIDYKPNLVEIIMREHDYFQMEVEETPKDTINEIDPLPQIEITTTAKGTDAVPSLDHDYFSPAEPVAQSPKEVEETKAESPKKEQKSPKKPGNSSSDSSSDSDSSSCTCGSNCSCSSSSGTSSSSSDSSDSDSSTSEGRRRQQARRERRKQKAKSKNKTKDKESETVVDVTATDKPPLVPNVETSIEESDLETTESETDEDFYDEQPLKLASKNLTEKRNQLLNDAGATANGSLIETSRPSTPSLPPEEAKPKKKSKSKKRKKKKSARYSESALHEENIPVNTTPTVAPLTLTIPRDSPVSIPPASLTPSVSNMEQGSDTDQNLRSSKRRRVPNKFYGYSSDEEQDKPHAKWRKSDVLPPSIPSSSTPPVVPPITIKTVLPPKPPVDAINRNYQQAEFHRARFMQQQQLQQPRLYQQPPIEPRPLPERDSGTESNDSSEEEQMTVLPPKANQPALYCYCRCPYDEVSEMIGCDAADCAIEWFHFECVGIMVPPKGQWYCPDCRKKKQQRKEV